MHGSFLFFERTEKAREKNTKKEEEEKLNRQNIYSKEGSKLR
jgi:hypothetical protein